MKMKIHSILILGLLLFGTSCEKEIKISLTSKDKLIVVEGVIENGQNPYVTLTNSIGFFDKIDLSKIQYIQNANVNVQDIVTGVAINLLEYHIDTTIGNQTFSFGIYGPDFLDPVASNFKGQVGHSYFLKIESEGKTYSSYTTIPEAKGLDSVWTEPVPGREDSFAVLKAFYTDPDTLGNSVRIETKVNRYIKDSSIERFLTSFNSVYNDDIVNGVRIPISIDLGYDKSKQYSNSDFQTLGFLRRGDTVTLKWSAIDRGVFKFWETLSYSAGSVGNPFASPTKIQSNVKDALGIWGGYNPTYYTVVDTIQ